MFKNLSLKIKIFIFSVAALIGIGIIVSTGIKNRQTTKYYKFNETSQLQQVDEKKKAEEEEAKKKQEEEALKAQKLKALEEKYEKGYEAFNNRMYSEAIKIEDEVIKEDDKFYRAYNIKGIALCYFGNYQEGMKSIEKALELKSDYGYARFNKALALELYGKYDESLQWYDKALEVENFVWSHYGKASIYGRKGDVINTVKNLKLAIELNKDVIEEAKKERDFDKVRNSREFQDLIK